MTEQPPAPPAEAVDTATEFTSGATPSDNTHDVHNRQQTGAPPEDAGHGANDPLAETMAFLEGLNQPQTESDPGPEATAEAPEENQEETSSSSPSAGTEDPAEETEATPPGDTPADDAAATTEGDTNEPGTIDDETGAAKSANPRIRLNPKRWEGREKDFAAIQLADKFGISLDEARTRLGNSPTATAAAASAAANTAATPTPIPGDVPGGESGLATADATAPAAPALTAEAIEARLAAIPGEQDEADDAFDTKRGRALDREERKLREQLTEIRQSQQNEVSAFTASLHESAGRIEEAYPGAFAQAAAGESPGTLALAVEAEVERLRASNPALFNDPEWPEYVVPKVALRLGLAPASAAPAAPAPVKPAAATAKPSAKTTPPRTAAATVAATRSTAAGPAPASGSRSPLPATRTPAGSSVSRLTLDDAMAQLEALGDHASAR